MGYSGPNLSNLSNIEPYTFVIYKSGSTYYAFESSSGSVKYSGATFTTVLSSCVGAISTRGSIFIKNPGTAITIGAKTTITDKNIHIYGDGSLLDFSSLNDIVFEFTDSSTFGVYNCGIHDFQCKGTYTNASEVVAKFSNVVGTVENCFTNTTDGVNRLVYLYGACMRSRIQNNKGRFYNPIKIEGYTSGSLREASYSSITDNNFDMFYDSSNLNYFADITNGLYIKVSNNSVIGNTYGVKTTTANYMTISGNNFHGGVITLDINSNFVTITGNVIIDGYLNFNAIKVYSTYGTTITGNIVYSAANNNFIGILLSGATRRTAITGNIIMQESTPTGTYGIYSASTTQECCIMNNIITATSAITATGISLAATTDCVICNNEIRLYSTKMSLGTLTNSWARRNIGHVTVNEGTTASVADGGTISHGLVSTPTGVVVTPTTSGEFVSVTAKGATTFTVAIKKHDNSAGTTQTLSWYAWI